MRLANGWMLRRRRFRTGVASGPYCASRSSRRIMVAVICLTWLVFWSKELFADAINRPSTSAAKVPMRPVAIFTTSLESGCRCSSDNKGRTTTHPNQSAAEYQREHKERDQQSVQD